MRHQSYVYFSFVAFDEILNLLLGVVYGAVVHYDDISIAGIFYFISAAASDFGVFFALWQDFGSAILESLPVAAITVFTINVALILFTVRLFLHRKKLLLSYLTNNY
jgi:hypothetical protein